jgi:hypothetical protein
MSTPATTIGAEAPLRAAVRSLASAQLRQPCVVDRTHRLVGVLALPDSLCLFLRGDAAIERDIEELVVGTHPGAAEVTVQVSAGIVTLNGALRVRSTVEHAGWAACRPRRDRRAELPALRIRRPHDHRTMTHDEQRPQPPAEAVDQ